MKLGFHQKIIFLKTELHLCFYLFSLPVDSLGSLNTILANNKLLKAVANGRVGRCLICLKGLLKGSIVVFWSHSVY